MHYLSIEALKLSLYLDGIGMSGDRSETEWHSLRTFLIDSDLQIWTKGKIPCTENEHVQLLTLLIQKIERFEGVETANNSKIELFNLDKSNFLRGLHSSAHNRLDIFWKEVDTGQIRNSPPTFKIDFSPNDVYDHGPFLENEDFSQPHLGEYYEHSIKFLKIQKWIQWHSGFDDAKSTPLGLNIRHNLHVGASAVLEGLFAKIRSKVLSEKRPGSITIDGGGRLCFISKNKSEKAWIGEIISNSLELDIQHPQPFAERLKKSIIDWGTTTKRIDKKKGLEQGEVSKFLNKEFSKITDKYYPQWSYNGSQENSATFEGFKDEQCHICIQSTNHETKSSPSEYLNQFEAKEHKNQVCAFHFLLFNLGEGVKIRQASQLMKQEFNPAHKSVKHVICLDGNGIGQIFNKPWEEIEKPKIKPIPESAPKTARVNQARKKKEDDQKILNELWSNQSEDITNLKKPWIEIKQEFEQQNEEGINFEENLEVCKEIYNRRNQAYLQRKRRSFCFNAKWWIAFNKGIYSNQDNHLEPFVAAGDDLILIDRAFEESEGVIKALESFADCLSQEFNNEIPISFGAGVAANLTTVAETIKKAEKVEVSAKKRWKQKIQAVPQYEHLIKESAREDVQRNAETLDETEFEEKTIGTQTGVECLVHIWNKNI